MFIIAAGERSALPYLYYFLRVIEASVSCVGIPRHRIP